MADRGLLKSILEEVPSSLVGPAPPSAVAGAENTTADARNAEMERVMAVLGKAGVHHFGTAAAQLHRSMAKVDLWAQVCRKTTYVQATHPSPCCAQIRL